MAGLVPSVLPCVVALGLAAVQVPVRAQLAAPNVLQEAGQRFHPVWSSKGIVASQEAIASSVAGAIPRQGPGLFPGPPQSGPQQPHKPRAESRACPGPRPCHRPQLPGKGPLGGYTRHVSQR